MSKIILFLIEIIFLASIIFGQSGNKWKIFHSFDSSIFSIEQDNQLNMWFGTWGEDGLIKYDWQNWIIYNDSSSGFVSEKVSAIDVDSRNNIWVATGDTGIVKYDGAEWTYYNLPDYAPFLYYNTAWDVAVDSRDNIWVGTYWGGLLKFDGINWTNYNDENSPIHQAMMEINCIDIDKKDNVWFGNDFDGIIMFNGKTTWIIYDRLSYKYSIKIGKNEIWSSGKYLHKFDGTRWILYENDDNHQAPIEIFVPWWIRQAIDIDTAGVKWFIGGLEERNRIWPSSVKSILRYNDTTATEIFPDTSKYDFEYATALKIDSYGNKWIGYSNGYIAVYNEDGVKGFSPTGIEDYETPAKFSLSPNYPNPFNPTTTIKYSIPSFVISTAGRNLGDSSPNYVGIRNDNVNVTLKVYDLLGREVATLVNKEQKPGSYEVEFSGNKLSSGVYFYTLKVYPATSGAGNFLLTKKMLLLK